MQDTCRTDHVNGQKIPGILFEQDGIAPLVYWVMGYVGHYEEAQSTAKAVAERTGAHVYVGDLRSSSWYARIRESVGRLSTLELLAGPGAIPDPERCIDDIIEVHATLEQELKPPTTTYVGHSQSSALGTKARAQGAAFDRMCLLAPYAWYCGPGAGILHPLLSWWGQ